MDFISGLAGEAIKVDACSAPLEVSLPGEDARSTLLVRDSSKRKHDDDSPPSSPADDCGAIPNSFHKSREPPPDSTNQGPMHGPREPLDLPKSIPGVFIGRQKMFLCDV